MASEGIGLALGALSLLIWVAERAVEIREDYQEMPDFLKTAHLDLVVQELRLRKAFEVVEISAADHRRSRQNHRPGYFLEPNGGFELALIGESLPSTDVDLILRIASSLPTSVRSLCELCDVDLDTKDKKSHLNATKRLRKLKYAWFRARYAKRFEMVRSQINSLCELISIVQPPPRQPSERARDEINPYDAEGCHSTREDLVSAHRALKTWLFCGCHVPHKAAIYLDRLTYASFDNVSYCVAVSCGVQHAGSSSQSIPLWRTIRLVPRADPPPPINPKGKATAGASPGKANLRPRHLLRRLPTPAAGSIALNTPPPEPAEPIPYAFSMCDAVTQGAGMGYITDSESTFACKVGTNESTRIVDLLPLAAARRHFGQPYQSPKHKYGMAAYAAWSILHLGGGPWLQDSVGAGQASAFIEEHAANQQKLSNYPCFDIEFSNASSGYQGIDGPATQEADADDLLASFSPNKTVLSVGLLLAEIFLDNRPSQEEQSPAPRPLAERLNFALKNYSDLRSAAGQSYADAVRKCLKSQFSVPDPEIDFRVSGFQEEFYTSIVVPIVAAYNLASQLERTSVW